MIPATSTKASMRPLIGNRLSRLVARQEENHAKLSADPLLDLKTVRTILGISYSGLNRLIHSKKLTAWQVGHGARRIRTSVLNAYVASGDPTPTEAKP
jgi:excisionase family DNA binding protein